MWNVPLFELNYDDAELTAVMTVLKSQWLTMGDKINLFESDFSKFLGDVSYSTAVTNCTAALHMALIAQEIGVGDEVIIPALTFIADANVVAMTGARPVLADCTSYDNWNVSARTITEKITDKTKAVIVVHFAGYPCEMDDIIALCKERGLILIEDVAHAPGATYKGRACGTMGDIGCFSFFSNKNLSIGEGGMFVTGNSDIHQKARYLRSHGMTTLTLDRHKGRAISYDVAQPGLNYRMDEIRAALGLVQLEKLPENNLQRGRLVQRYNEKLQNVAGITIPFLDLQEIESVYHIFPLLLDATVDRVVVIEALKKAGIQSSIHYPSFRTFTAYQDVNFPATPLADEISSRELTLPLFPTMTFEQVDLVVGSLLKALN
jgi:dTDP-4-amino-4,6-dideoxygalactose transaminase